MGYYSAGAAWDEASRLAFVRGQSGYDGRFDAPRAQTPAPPQLHQAGKCQKEEHS